MTGDLVTTGVSATDANGLRITDDSDTLGIFIADGGNVAIGSGTLTPGQQLCVVAPDSGACRMSLVAPDSGACRMSFQNLSTGYAANNGLMFGMNANEDGLYWHYSGGCHLYFATENTQRMMLTNDGKVIIGNDSSNNFMTIGLTINQAGNDDEILAFKSVM
jgi:hypothetical protein